VRRRRRREPREIVAALEHGNQPAAGMLYRGPAYPGSDGPVTMPLTQAHVPEMVALTSLTAPGPFSEETIRFGHYEGIFDDGKLVAMAGSGKLVSQDAVLTPSGSSGPLSMALPDPCDGPAHDTAGMGLAVPL